MDEENPVQPQPLIDDVPDTFPSPKKAAELLANLHTFELDKDYMPPQWSSKPTKNYFLEIIKNGVVIGQKDLNEKSFYLVGKLQDLSDIFLEHPSISRKHAVFQHKGDGCMYLYDLGSTHGTKVNKKDLAPKTFHKLGVGDVIKFGFSTRLFIVGLDGETAVKDSDEKLISSGFLREEKEEEAPNTKASLKSKYLELLNRQEGRQKAKKVAPSGPNEGISWGMVDEDEIRAYENEEDIRLDPDLMRELPNLNPKDYDKINEYEKKLRQLQGVEKELDVIYKKEQEEFGLTETDKVKRQNLETKVNEMFSKVQMMEDNLRFALFQEVKSTQDRIAKRREADSFEDDEFYDRTIKKVKLEDQLKDKKKPQDAAPEGETFESLKKKLEDMISLRQELNEKILALTLNPDANKEKEEEMDELDAFMKENETKVKAESMTQLVDALKETNVQIQELQRMLKFVRPSYSGDIQPQEKKPEEKKTQAQPQPKPAPKVEPKPQQTTLERLKQKQAKGAYLQTSRDQDDDEEGEPKRKQMIEPPKKKVYGVAPRPPPRNMRESDYENPEFVDSEWVPPSDKGESI